MAWTHRTIVMMLTLSAGTAMDTEATMYHCVDTSGAKVITDSPSQLRDCTVVTLGLTESLPSPSLNGMSNGPGASDLRPSSEDGEDGRARSAMRMLIPLEHAGHLLVVHAQFNDQRHARLILDTGASHTIVSQQIARDLGLLIDTGEGFVTLKTAGGTVQAGMSRIQTVRIGAAEAFNIPVAVHDLPDAPIGIDGLLGMTFLNQFLMTLDTQKSALVLQRR